MQPPLLLANDLVDCRHGVAIDGKATNGKVTTVRYKPLNGILQGHDLVGVNIHRLSVSVWHPSKEQKSSSWPTYDILIKTGIRVF